MTQLREYVDIVLITEDRKSTNDISNLCGEECKENGQEQYYQNEKRKKILFPMRLCTASDFKIKNARTN